MKISALIDIVGLSHCQIERWPWPCYGEGSKVLVAYRGDVVIQAVYDANECIHMIVAVHHGDTLFWHSHDTHQQYLDEVQRRNEMPHQTTVYVDYARVLSQIETLWNEGTFNVTQPITIQLSADTLSFIEERALTRHQTLEEVIEDILHKFTQDQEAKEVKTLF